MLLIDVMCCLLMNTLRENSIETRGEQDKLTIYDLRFTIRGMYIGMVTGTVVATIKHGAFNGRKLLIVDQLGTDGEPTGSYDICVDTVQAGVGDRVLVLDEGNGARQILGMSSAPIRAVVVGIVDEFSVDGNQ
jgi:microcompartment protein CcmK/EutM